MTKTLWRCLQISAAKIDTQNYGKSLELASFSFRIFKEVLSILSFYSLSFPPEQETAWKLPVFSLICNLLAGKITPPLTHPAGKERYVKGTAKAAPSPGSGVSDFTQRPPSSWF